MSVLICRSCNSIWSIVSTGPLSKDVPTTYSWNSMPVCYSQSQKGIGPNLYAGGVGFTGGSLGTLPVINIPKESFKVDGNNY